MLGGMSKKEKKKRSLYSGGMSNIDEKIRIIALVRPLLRILPLLVVSICFERFHRRYDGHQPSLSKGH